MKLVVLTRQFGNYTGATIATMQLIDEWKKSFSDITILTLRSSEQVDDNKITVKKFSGLKEIREYMFKLNPEVGNIVGYSDDHLGFLFKKVKIPYIHTYHGNWPDARWLSFKNFISSFIFIPLYKKTIKNASYVVSVSQYMQEKFVGKYNHKNKVIYNGVQVIDNSIVSHATTSNKVKFVMVGNVDERKYGNAVKTFAKISKSTQDKISVDIFGKIVSQSVADKLNKFKFVNIKGFIKKIDYKNYNFTLCLSKSENLPLSIVESLVSGVPVMAFDVGGINEVIDDGLNGTLISAGQIETFAQQLDKIVKSNDYHVDIKRINGTFNWQRAASEYVVLFNNIENGGH